MAQETWLIEFMSALVFSQGGRFTDDKGNATMHSRTAVPSRHSPGWSQGAKGQDAVGLVRRDR